MIASNSKNCRTRIITELDDFAACRETWNELAGDRVFHRWEWMYSWWETWQDTGQLAIVVVLDDADRWVGIAPWYRSRIPQRGNAVRLLGSGRACSDYVSVVFRPGFELAVADRLAQVIAGNDPDSCFADIDLIELDGHREDDPVMSRMHQVLGAGSDAEVFCEEIGGTWISPLADTWDEFESRLRKSFRRKTRKAGQRLESADFHGEVFETPEDIERLWPDFVDLHQRRRTSLGQPGCFADPQFESFLKSATLRLASSADAQLNAVYFQGQVLTTNLQFTSGDTVFMYQTGVDPDLIRLEPGHINFTWAIRSSIGRQYRCFDFLRGDEPYKSRWNAVRVPLFSTRIVPNRWRARLRNSLWTTGRQVRGWARSVVKSAGRGGKR